MTAKAWKEAGRSEELTIAGREKAKGRALLQHEDLKTVQVMDTEFTKVKAVFVRGSVRERMERQGSNERADLDTNLIESRSMFDVLKVKVYDPESILHELIN